MNNSDDKEKDKVINIDDHRIVDQREKLEGEILELITLLNKDMKENEKRQKQLKVLSFSLLTYILTIVVVGVSAILYPPFRPIADFYLTFCNVLGVGLCVWNGIGLFKSGLIKEPTGKWLFAFAIFGTLINIFAVLDNFIIERFLQ